MFDLRLLAGPSTVAAALVLSPSALAGFGITVPSPAAIAMTADVVIVGKITEFERDVVEAVPQQGGPRAPKVRYKVAVLKVEDALIGAKGFTQVRVGVAEPPPARPGVTPAPAPVIGQEGCYFLTRHSAADFLIPQTGFGVIPLLTTRPDYERELARVKLVAKAIDDPIPALKAKAVEDRFLAAQAVMTHYWRVIPAQTTVGGGPPVEDIPAGENKLILGIMLELPWYPAGVRPGPPNMMDTCRSALWRHVQAERYGFKGPSGVGPDFGKKWEEATTAFLKDNLDKIKLQKVVLPK